MRTLLLLLMLLVTACGRSQTMNATVVSVGTVVKYAPIAELALTNLVIDFAPFSDVIFMESRVRRRNGLSAVPINESKVLFWTDDWRYTMLTVPTGWRLANEDADCALIGPTNDMRLVLADTCYNVSNALQVFEYTLGMSNGLPTTLTQVEHQQFGTNCLNLRTLALPTGGLFVEAYQGGPINDYNSYIGYRDTNGTWSFQFIDLGNGPCEAGFTELANGQDGRIYEFISGDGTARIAMLRWKETATNTIAFVDWDFCYLCGGDVDLAPDGENPWLKLGVSGTNIFLSYQSITGSKFGCIHRLARPVIVSINTAVDPPTKTEVCFIPLYQERASAYISFHLSGSRMYYHTTPMDSPVCDMSNLYKRQIVGTNTVAAEDIGFSTPCDYILKAWSFDDQANGVCLVQRGRTLFLKNVIPNL